MTLISDKTMVKMEELKEELGSWFIADYELYVGA